MVEDLVEEIARWRSKIVVVGGDFNVKVRSWESAIDDRTGRLLEDGMASVDLQCVNQRGEITLEREGVGISDLTFVNIQAGRGCREVLGEETLSDHRLITFEIGDIIQEERAGTRSVRFHLGSVAQFRTAIAFELGCSEDTDLNELTDTVFSVEVETGVIKEVTAGRAGVYWWTPELAELRRRCVGEDVSRRCLKQSQRRVEKIEEELGRLRLARRNFRGAISVSKKCKWQQLCDAVEIDSRGDAYRFVTEMFGRRLPLLTDDELRNGVDKLFPKGVDFQREEIVVESMVPFSLQDLSEATKLIKGDFRYTCEGCCTNILRTDSR
ncbi:uncharacterized protein LOC142317479 [Lycorma delicatula]|uniref:uncharacterized protein LOC142317479 n=1 Tax=Lycorma delicatula TaxID=130591 RepID=UPI003F51AC0F